MEFDWIRRADGSSEFLDFVNSLPDRDATKLLAVIQKTEDHGLLIASRMLWIKKLEKDLYELRSACGSNIQRVIYFHLEQNRFIITYGFSKKSQKTPRSEIVRAQMMSNRYREDIRHEQDR